MSTPTQDNRPIVLKSVLGKDVLLFRKMTARERLNTPFTFEIEAYSEDTQIDFNALMGTPMSVCLEMPEDRKRYFNGWVSEFAQTPSESPHGYAAYRIVLRPWLWFLSRVSDCRIFQDKKVPQILEDIFGHHGFTDYDFAKLSIGDYPLHEYCVQYRETDFNFISRLIETQGIGYFFEHTEDEKHILTLVDEPSDFASAPGYAVIPYAKTVHAGDTSPRQEAIFNWIQQQSLQPGAVALNSYDFVKPGNMTAQNPLYSLVNQPFEHPHGQLPIYDYPGPDDFTDTEAGRRYARIRLEELKTQHASAIAKTSALGLCVGKLFSLSEHPRDDQNTQWLVNSSVIHVSQDYYESQGSGSESGFVCEFSVLPGQQQYRPKRVTPRPFVQGPQTAVVVPEKGQEGEEISTDEHGRVKVKFPWYRPEENMDGKNPQDRSCWIRVSQPWAGKNWGAIAIPRHGQEVIVDFLEGNPDRPIITGRVYNGDQKTPYGLPANKTQTGIKTRSSKGGGEANFNEIRFEDKKGEEQLFIHAEKNQDIEVENDETHWVGHDRSKTIDNDETSHIKHNRTETVDNDETITVKNNRTETVLGNETISIGKNRIETVGQNENITVTMNRARQVGMNENISIGANKGLQIGGSVSTAIGGNNSNTISGDESTGIGKGRSEKVAQDEAVGIGKNRSHQVGENDTLAVGKKLTINAGDQISITTGKASILMKKDGTITIKGKDITIDGSGKITVKASKNVIIKGKKVLEN